MKIEKSSERNFKTIPKRLLVGVYLILPFLLGVIAVDWFFLDARLLPHFGIEGLFLPFFILLFNLPHIIASFFSFFDSEYVQYYRRHLTLYLPLLLTATAVLLYYDFVLGLVFFLVNDIWHGVRQQAGISLILGSKYGVIHRLWTILPFITASIAYVYIIRPNAYPDFLVSYISPVLLIGMILFFFVMIAKIVTSPIGARWFVFFASMLFFSSYFFILSGYIFFSIFAFRFVHDVSAFAFYVTHDYNRASAGYKNYLYRLFFALPNHILVAVPILGILFAYLIRVATNGLAIGYSIVILICMSHFYLESVMWKRNAPHRGFVKVE
jgi:hypothetical protein